MTIATTLFFLICGYLAFLIVGYAPLMRYLTRNRPVPRAEQAPEVTVVVPAFNEETNIDRKIEDLRKLEYPAEKMEILVVDNSSTDRTREIASSYPVTVLNSPRGKINAINVGIQNARSEIVVVTDADTVLKPDALASLVTCYADERIGAVGGTAVVEASHPFFGRSKTKYHEADWELRALEGRLDTVISLDGKLMSFRKTLLPEFPPDCIVDDLEINFRLRSQGYRSIIDAQAVVYETGPQSFKAEMKQIRRRVALTIPVLFRYIHMLMNPRYGWFGLLIFPVRRMLAVFSPLMLVYVGSYLLVWNWKIAILSGVAVSAFIIAKAHYFPVIQQVGILLGWLDVLTLRIGSAAQWEK